MGAVEGASAYTAIPRRRRVHATDKAFAVPPSRMTGGSTLAPLVPTLRFKEYR